MVAMPTDSRQTTDARVVVTLVSSLLNGNKVETKLSTQILEKRLLSKANFFRKVICDNRCKRYNGTRTFGHIELLCNEPLM